MALPCLQHQVCCPEHKSGINISTFLDVKQVTFLAYTAPAQMRSRASAEVGHWSKCWLLIMESIATRLYTSTFLSRYPAPLAYMSHAAQFNSHSFFSHLGSNDFNPRKRFLNSTRVRPKSFPAGFTSTYHISDCVLKLAHVSPKGITSYSKRTTVTHPRLYL